jgi:hypothetical protein
MTAGRGPVCKFFRFLAGPIPLGRSLGCARQARGLSSVLSRKIVDKTGGCDDLPKVGVRTPVVPPGLYRHGLRFPGAERAGLLPVVPPGLYRHGLRFPGAERAGLLPVVPPGLYRYGLRFPGAERAGLLPVVPPGLDRHGLRFPGAERAGLLPVVPPGLYRYGLRFPGAERAGLWSVAPPGLGRWLFGPLRQAGFRSPRMRRPEQRTKAAENTRSLDFAPLRSVGMTELFRAYSPIFAN